MIIEEKNKIYMKLALEEAKKAYEIDEVPVGAIIVYKDEVIASGYNQREIKNNSLAHAEILAINQACNYLDSWRLIDCEMYVTLEPCPMCAGAIINSRISKLIYATQDLKSGSVNSILNMFDLPFNHKPEVIADVLADESSELLKNFFKQLRTKNKR